MLIDSELIVDVAGRKRAFTGKTCRNGARKEALCPPGPVLTGRRGRLPGVGGYEGQRFARGRVGTRAFAYLCVSEKMFYRRKRREQRILTDGPLLWSAQTCLRFGMPRHVAAGKPVRERIELRRVVPRLQKRRHAAALQIGDAPKFARMREDSRGFAHVRLFVRIGKNCFTGGNRGNRGGYEFPICDFRLEKGQVGTPLPLFASVHCRIPRHRLGSRGFALVRLFVRMGIKRNAEGGMINNQGTKERRTLPAAGPVLTGGRGTSAWGKTRTTGGLRRVKQLNKGKNSLSRIFSFFDTRTAMNYTKQSNETKARNAPRREASIDRHARTRACVEIAPYHSESVGLRRLATDNDGWRRVELFFRRDEPPSHQGTKGGC
jgi:hypothetical protein